MFCKLVLLLILITSYVNLILSVNVTIVTLKPGKEFNLTSPGYPDKFKAGSSASWIIKAPANFKIHVRCFDFGIVSSPNCTKDVLILNGERFCSSFKSRYFSDKNNTLVAKFKSTTNTGKLRCRVWPTFDSCNCGQTKTDVSNFNCAIL